LTVKLHSRYVNESGVGVGNSGKVRVGVVHFATDSTTLFCRKKLKPERRPALDVSQEKHRSIFIRIADNAQPQPAGCALL